VRGFILTGALSGLRQLPNIWREEMKGGLQIVGAKGEERISGDDSLLTERESVVESSGAGIIGSEG